MPMTGISIPIFRRGDAGKVLVSLEVSGNLLVAIIELSVPPHCFHNRLWSNAWLTGAALFDPYPWGEMETEKLGGVHIVSRAVIWM